MVREDYIISRMSSVKILYSYNTQCLLIFQILIRKRILDCKERLSYLESTVSKNCKPESDTVFSNIILNSKVGIEQRTFTSYKKKSKTIEGYLLAEQSSLLLSNQKLLDLNGLLKLEINEVENLIQDQNYQLEKLLIEGKSQKILNQNFKSFKQLFRDLNSCQKFIGSIPKFEWKKQSDKLVALTTQKMEDGHFLRVNSFNSKKQKKRAKRRSSIINSLHTSLQFIPPDNRSCNSPLKLNSSKNDLKHKELLKKRQKTIYVLNQIPIALKNIRLLGVLQNEMSHKDISLNKLSLQLHDQCSQNKDVLKVRISHLRIIIYIEESKEASKASPTREETY